MCMFNPPRSCLSNPRVLCELFRRHQAVSCLARYSDSAVVVQKKTFIPQGFQQSCIDRDVLFEAFEQLSWIYMRFMQAFS